MFRRNWLDGERGEGLILLDEEGEVIHSNTRDRVFTGALEKQKHRGVPVVVDGKEVGVVISASSLGVLNTVQNGFLQNVNRQRVLTATLAMKCSFSTLCSLSQVIDQLIDSS